MKSNIFKYVFFAIVIILIILAIYILYKDGNNNSFAKEENKMQINMIEEINIGIVGFDIINPLLSSNKDVQYISKLIFEPLLDITKDFKIENKLAKEFSKINDKTYIIKLRDDLYWHDKTKFTSQDVIFTIENLKKDTVNSIYKESVNKIDEVEAIDEYTVRIVLKEETPFFEYKMCFPILSKNSYEEDTLISKTNLPIGIGEYKIIEENENLIKLEIVDKESKSNIKKINVILKNNSKELYNSFLKRELDYIITDSIDYEKYLGTMGYNVNQVQDRKYLYLVLNNKNYFLQNKEIRNAINLAIDRNKINYNIYNNKYLISNFPINNENYFNDSIIKNNYNINKAKSILIEEGWTYKNNIWKNKNHILRFNLVTNEERALLAEQIKESLEDIGIIINIIKVDENLYNTYLKNKNYDMILTENIISNSPNLETYFGDNNLSNYNNREIGRILKDIRNINDFELLKEKYIRLEEIYNEEIPFISLYSNSLFILSNKDLKGDLSCNWYNLFYNIDGWYKIKK